MKSSPEPLEQRLAELDELFGPEQAAYGESYAERLREDEEVSAKIHERFERGKASGRFPALSNLLSNLSAKEIEMFFKTGGTQAIGFRDIVPQDVGVRFRQLQELLRREPEFCTRYPEASDILFPKRAERVGVPLPSFGVRILRHEPHFHAYIPEEPIGRAIGGDAYSATYLDKLEMGDPPADPSFLPVNPGLLRGVLLAILGREEYSERIAPLGRNSKLLEGVEVPRECAVRVTDLRLALVLELEESKRFLLPALRSLEIPITAERVIEWKRRIIGDKVEDKPDPFWEEFGDRINKLANKAASGYPDQEACDALKEEMLAYKEAHPPEPPTVGLTEEELVNRRIETATVSFAAAALFLFMDLGMPGLRDEKPFRLDEQIKELAAIIKKLMDALCKGGQKLEKLISNRPAGRSSDPESRFYYALCYWRYGHSPEDIARWLGITPYSSKMGEGTRNWKTKLNRMLARGKEIENERYPRAAAIFANYRDSPHVRRKAYQAYRAYLVQTNRFPGYPPLNEVGRKIRVNHQTRRGLEIIQAYIQLGSCLVRGKPTAP